MSLTLSFPSASRLLRAGAMLTLAVTASVPSTASAHWFGFGRNRCSACDAPPPSYAAAAAPVYATAYAAPTSGCGCGVSSVSVAASPVIQQTACAAPVIQQTACVAVQPVQQTVYQEVPVTKYKQVTRTERRPVNKIAYRDEEVTVMQQVTEQRTAAVPYTTYQNVTEYQPRTRDLSHWQTTYRPNCKVSPCEYDRRPGFLGWMNRTRQEVKNAFTPDQVAMRQYVPNVQTEMVAVNRQIPIQATRQVTYNVAKMVPVKTRQKVAYMKQEFEEVPVTAMVPYTEMQTVAVGTQTQMAYVGLGGGALTAAAPSPTRSAKTDQPVPRKASNNRQDKAKLQSYSPEADRNDADNQNDDGRSYDGLRAGGRFVLPQSPKPRETRNLNVRTRPQPSTKDANDPRLAGYRIRRTDLASNDRNADADRWLVKTSPRVLTVAGWKPVRSKMTGPELNVAMNDR